MPSITNKLWDKANKWTSGKSIRPEFMRTTIGPRVKTFLYYAMIAMVMLFTLNLHLVSGFTKAFTSEFNSQYVFV